MKFDKIIYHPIGVVHSTLKDIGNAPIQPSGAIGIKATVELGKDYTEGLKDLDGFSHIILIYHLHLSNGFSLNIIPFLDTVPRGLFATRAPRRPNQIGLSVVKLIKIEENRLYIENNDLVDGTPLLDIKPYIKDFDSASESKNGWYDKSTHKSENIRSDSRFR